MSSCGGFGGNDSMGLILILLLCCGGCGSSCGNNSIGGCGSDSSMWLILILLLCGCGGNGFNMCEAK